MAAVRERSAQNWRRASGLIAINPSALRALAKRTTSAAASATARSSSLTISAISTIFGNVPRAPLGVYLTALT